MSDLQHTFVGRAGELESLSAAYSADGGQLVLLFGRRRIGKTYLLQRFTQKRRAIFYQATRQSEPLELASFTALVASHFRMLPPGYVFPNWEAALEYLDERAKEKRLVVILDEFSYLCESTPGLASIVQRWWDRRGRKSGVMLVLCGSAQTMMADLESSSAPLFGRFTKRIVLGPLSYREAAEFVPHLKFAERAIVYGLLGGTPLYLKAWVQRETLRENLLRLFSDPGSLLVESARIVLHTDLGDGTAAYRALAAIAGGATKRNDILQKAHVTNERVIARLEELDLITKVVPITEGAHSRRGVYRVTDPYFRFWFRFIEPNSASIDRGLGEQLIDHTVLPELDAHMGTVFEDMARTFVVDLVKRGTLNAVDVGSWWSTDGDHEIDIVGITPRGPSFVGTVKWRAAPLDRKVYDNLVAHAHALGTGDGIPWLMIGRGGVSAAVLRNAPHVRGYDIGALYGADRHHG